MKIYAKLLWEIRDAYAPQVIFVETCRNALAPQGGQGVRPPNEQDMHKWPLLKAENAIEGGRGCVAGGHIIN